MSSTSANVKKDNAAPSKYLLTPDEMVEFLRRLLQRWKNIDHWCLLFVPSAKEPPKITTVTATKGKGDDETEEISYTDAKVIGNGSFGVVYQARLIGSNELVAIKKVLQDRRYKVSIFVGNQRIHSRKTGILPNNFFWFF